MRETAREYIPGIYEGLEPRKSIFQGTLALPIVVVKPRVIWDPEISIIMTNGALRTQIMRASDQALTEQILRATMTLTWVDHELCQALRHAFY